MWWGSTPSTKLDPEMSVMMSTFPRMVDVRIRKLFVQRTSRWSSLFYSLSFPSSILFLWSFSCSFVTIHWKKKKNQNINEFPSFHFCFFATAPVAPDKQTFVRSNITSVSLNLNVWRDGGCPISNFIIQFKPKVQPEWILLSNRILPEQETVIIRELNPGTWHDLLILVKNEAGTTEANYVFATLTRSGATIAPMLLSDHGSGGLRSPVDAVIVLIPSVCAILLLFFVGAAAIYMLSCKKRLQHPHSDHCKSCQSCPNYFYFFPHVQFCSDMSLTSLSVFLLFPPALLHWFLSPSLNSQYLTCLSSAFIRFSCFHLFVSLVSFFCSGPQKSVFLFTSWSSSFSWTSSVSFLFFSLMTGIFRITRRSTT